MYRLSNPPFSGLHMKLHNVLALCVSGDHDQTLYIEPGAIKSTARTMYTKWIIINNIVWLQWCAWTEVPLSFLNTDWVMCACWARWYSCILLDRVYCIQLTSVMCTTLWCGLACAIRSSWMYVHAACIRSTTVIWVYMDWPIYSGCMLIVLAPEVVMETDLRL